MKIPLPQLPAKRDLLIIAVTAVLSLLISIQFHLYEKFVDALQAYHDYFLEEVVFTLLILSVLFALFSFRRLKEQKAQSQQYLLSEQARKVTELRSLALLTTIPNMTFRIRKDGVYMDFRAGNTDDLVDWNNDIIGKNVVDRLPPDIAQLYMHHIGQALDSNAIQSFEYELTVRKTSKRFQARMIASGADEVFVLVRNSTDSDIISEALAESETRFKAVVESLSEGLILSDLNDNVLYMNEKMTELCGWKIEEVRNKSAYSFLLPKEQWEIHRQRNNNRLQGVSELYESEMFRKDGSRFWAEIYGSPFRDANKNIVGTIGTITDISERRWNERLQSSLYRIATISRSVADIQHLYKMIHEVVGELMYAKNFYIALHDPVSNIISFPYFVDEYDSPPPPRKFSHGSTEYILHTGNILHAPQPVFDDMSKHGDLELLGSPAVDWLGVPLRSGDTTFGILAIQSYDPTIMFGEREKEVLVFVSQHISTIIQQKFEEERFRAIWEHSADGMRVSDKNGNIVMVNDAYCTMVQLERPELIGKPIGVVYQQNDVEKKAGEELYEQRFSSQTIIPRCDAQITLWNGETLTVEIDSLYLTFGVNERMLLSIFRDITERKKLEEQLLHAQKMDSIGVLAGGIAHDFNNVLAMILGSAELIKHKSKEYPDILKFAQMIATAAERGSSIAKQLLMFARTEKGMLRPTSLSKVVENVSELLEHSIPKSISIRLENHTDHDIILGDEDQLHQVIINLAVNARDAIEQKGESHGTLTFTISSHEAEDLKKRFPQISDSMYVVLEVSDNGSGMDEKTIHRVFEPFFSTKIRGKGTGLGLSIVHGIMKNHTAFIDIHSAVGVGTSFYLYFPALLKTDSSNGHAKNRVDEELSD